MLFCAIPINAATVIGSVLTTDIKAYINGCEVPSYNIDGNIVVVGQDLRSYGFNVVYDNNTRTSYISYDGSGTWTPIAPSIENSQSIGTKVMDVYQSDISVSVNGNKVACYNVGGKMAFRFAELKVFGNYSYDNETRSANLWVDETKSNEIDNVSAVASSSVANDFENIYIDESGNLIFELSNGIVINAGAVLNGKDGRDGQDGESGRNGLNGRDGNDGEDGVSIVNAYVDSEGDLIVELSNHKVINAGNVGSNYSADKLTFADYEVGTKFYLTQPTGEFSVTVNVNDTPYLVGFTDIYYELTAKHDFSDEDAWIYKDYKTQFVPYEIELHNEDIDYASVDGRDYYYRDGTWSEISLNAENFFDFFEYKENFRIYRNAFGEWERAEISRRYTLKDEYKLLYGYEYKCGKNVAAKLSVDTYLTEYTIDFDNETYTVATPGEFYETEIIDRESQYVVDLRISLPSIVLYPDDRDSVNKYYIFDLIDATGTLYLSTNTDR